jgi:DMSO/TMAO reductase YedYZ heme-binding membrane subunit
MSIAMLAIALAGFAIKIWPLIVANWLAFAAFTFAIGHRVSFVRKDRAISKPDHNLWRVVILAFSLCGFAAFAAGAQIV